MSYILINATLSVRVKPTDRPIICANDKQNESCNFKEHAFSDFL